MTYTLATSEFVKLKFAAITFATSGFGKSKFATIKSETSELLTLEGDKPLSFFDCLMKYYLPRTSL